MSGVLGTSPQADDLAPPVPIAEPASMGEVFGASRVLARGDRMDARWERMRRGYEPVLAEINADRAKRGAKALRNPGLWGSDLERRPSDDAGPFDFASLGSKRVDARQQQALIFAELGKIRARNPAFLKGVPDSADAFGQSLIAREQGDRETARGTLARSSGIGDTLAGFGGSVFETMHDPVNLWSLPLGGGGRTLVSQVGRSILVNGALEAVQQPMVAENRAALGEDLSLGEAAANVGFAAAGGVFGDVVIPRAAGLAARGVAAVADKVAPFDRRIAASLSHAQLPDHELAARFGATVPPQVRGFDEQAALHVIQREAEVRESSPFVPGGAGDDAHAARLGDAIESLLHGARGTARVPRGTSPAASPAMQYRAILGLEGGLDRAGNFRTSPAGAIGPAQLMPGTAPEAARLAGLPFDEGRYRGDADYNRQLGEAYYAAQLKTFGDPDKAAAAYNAGAGNVRKALAKAAQSGDPDGWERFLPAETQAYVRNFRDRTGGQPSQGVEVDAAGEPVLRPAAMDAERVAIDGPAPVSIDMPALRRDQFPNEHSYQIAQAAADANVLGVERPTAFDPPAEQPKRKPPVATVSQAEADDLEAKGLGPASVLSFLPEKGEPGISIEAADGHFASAVLRDGDGKAQAVVQMPITAEARDVMPEVLSYVRPEARRQGVATKLYDALEEAGYPVDRLSGTGDLTPDGAAFINARAERGTAAVPRETAGSEAPAMSEGRPVMLPPAEAARVLEPFDDPHGEGAKMQGDSLLHDLRAQIGKAPTEGSFRLEDGSEKTAAEILADIEEDQAVLKTIGDCL